LENIVSSTDRASEPSEVRTSALLEVEHLTTVFPLPDGREAEAVSDVSLRLDPQETLCLVGESGSGKSVTALSIVRLVLPPGRIAAGSVRLNGRDLLRLGEDGMRAVRGRRIGFVFQEPMAALDPVHTIGAHIVEALETHGLARGRAAWRRAVDLMGRARIPDAARRARDFPHQLSGGLRQRAMIAIALAADPDLLIADEPTTALDVTIQAEVLELLHDLKDQFGLSLLLITHDMGVVAEMADRVAVMYGGRIVEQGGVSDILADPAHPYTRALIASIPGAEPGTRLRAIPGNAPALGRVPPGCAFAPRCADRFEPCTRLPQLASVGAGRDARCFLYPGAGA
jgi:peptide/nickel transport system ATP-binding protein